MTGTSSEWLTTCMNRASADGERLYLKTVIGPIEVINNGPEPIKLSWPPHHIHTETPDPPVITLVISDERPPHEIAQTLKSDATYRSDRSGRGAFPVRWLPGDPWLARYENGPLVARRRNRILLAAQGSSEASAWTDRVLREALIHGSRRHGFRLCHCAVIAGDHGGLVITGPSGVGKTNLALKLSRQLHANTVTVDRGIIGSRDGHPAVGTLPFGLNIHHDTLAGLGCLNDTLIRRYPASNDKHYLTVEDAERHCGVTLTPWSRIRGVVELDQSATTTQWRRLDHADAERVLQASDSTDTDPGYQTDWLGMGGVPQAPLPVAGRMLAGWALSYRPDRPLPISWLHDVADVLHTPVRKMR